MGAGRSRYRRHARWIALAIALPLTFAVSAVSPSAAATMDNMFFRSVACPSATTCVAVGQYQDAASNVKSLIERWNGQHWSVVGHPERGTDSTLLGVSCPSVTSCFASGSYTVNSESKPFIM